MGASIASTRPYASGVGGRRTFFNFSSHGRSAPAHEGWNYGVLAQELTTVAREVGARRALGVSMGAGAIVRALADAVALPDAAVAPSAQRDLPFERAVLVLPANVDDPRVSEGLQRYELLADASEAKDTSALTQLLAEELDANVRATEAGQAWLAQQADAFAADGMASALRNLVHSAPVESAEVLRRIEIPVLILAQHGDEVHPMSAARRLADYLPHADLQEFEPGGLLFAHRARVRELVTSFLGADSTP